MINEALVWVMQTLDNVFYHFRGIYYALGFDIVGFLIVSYGILSVMRMATNGTLSLSKTIDIPKHESVRSSSGWRSSGDSGEDISKG